MSGLSKYAQPKVLGLIFGNTAYSVPATYYLAAFSTTPTDQGGTELSGNGYARVSITNNTTNFPA